MVDERAKLLGWIDGSMRFRRTLRVVMAIAAVIAFTIWWRWSMIGGTALFVVGAVYAIGWWITFGHISDWRARLEVLDRQGRARKT